MKALLGIADEYQPKKHQSGTFRTVASGGGGSGGSGGYSSSSGDIKARPGTSKGVCGLVNLGTVVATHLSLPMDVTLTRVVLRAGNTCFLNSAIQCLSNTTALTEFFLSDAFKADINKSNPLGMKGQLADCYGTVGLVLLCLRACNVSDELWLTTVPLRRCAAQAGVVGRLLGRGAAQPQALHRQVRAAVQRLLAARRPGVPGLPSRRSPRGPQPSTSLPTRCAANAFVSFSPCVCRMNVNQVLNKPYVEIKESDGRADEEVSREAWEAHLKRNRSVIVDLFQGQLKRYTTARSTRSVGSFSIVCVARAVR
jgi:hypothetical protein